MIDQRGLLSIQRNFNYVTSFRLPRTSLDYTEHNPDGRTYGPQYNNQQNNLRNKQQIWRQSLQFSLFNKTFKFILTEEHYLLVYNAV
jgi:hypothetical protein